MGACFGKLRMMLRYGTLFCDQLEALGVQPHVKSAVLDALQRAPEDDPILILFWNEAGLQRGDVKAGQTQAAIVETLVAQGAVPAQSAPNEVFNLEHGQQVPLIRNRLLQTHLWAFGDVPGLGVVVHGRPPVARAVVISELKRKRPEIVSYPLFV